MSKASKKLYDDDDDVFRGCYDDPDDINDSDVPKQIATKEKNIKANIIKGKLSPKAKIALANKSQFEIDKERKEKILLLKQQKEDEEIAAYKLKKANKAKAIALSAQNVLIKEKAEAEAAVLKAIEDEAKAKEAATEALRIQNEDLDWDAQE